jgi:NAD(P)-dependent dehydrogenase (short-subunit alcohol dehydrogenase family)
MTIGQVASGVRGLARMHSEFWGERIRRDPIDYAALKRFGKTEEIAELLAFCASDKASYTGVDILCDGGVIAAMTPRGKLAVGRNS